MRIRYIYLLLTLFTFIGCSSLPGTEEKKIVDTKNKAAEYLNDGTSQYNAGRYERALELFQVAFNLNASIDNEEGIVAVYNSIGKTKLMEGEYEEALKVLENAMAVSRRLENHSLELTTAGNLVDYYIRVGDLNTAEDILIDNFSLNSSVDSEETASLAHKYSLLLRKKEDYTGALQYLNKSLEYNEKKRLYKALAADFYLMASVYSLMKDYDRAVMYGEEALRYDKLIEFPQGIAADLEALSIILGKAGRETESGIYAERYKIVINAINALNKIKDDQSDDVTSAE